MLGYKMVKNFWLTTLFFNMAAENGILVGNDGNCTPVRANLPPWGLIYPPWGLIYFTAWAIMSS